MSSWRSVEKDFRAIPDPHNELRADWSHQKSMPNVWRVAGGSYRGAGDRFEAIARLAGKALFNDPGIVAILPEQVVKENDPFNRWLTAVRLITHRFESGPVLQLGESANLILTGSISNVIDSSALLCLHLASAENPSDDPKAKEQNNNKESQVVATAWRLMQDSYGKAVRVISPGKVCPDLSRMPEPQFEAVLASCRLAEFQKDEVRRAADRTKEYQKWIYWVDLDEAKSAQAFFHNHLVGNRIFMTDEVSRKLFSIDIDLNEALIEHENGLGRSSDLLESSASRIRHLPEKIADVEIILKKRIQTLDRHNQDIAKGIPHKLDSLLQIYDRGQFDQDLSEQLDQANSTRPMAALMIDLDDFKTVNDTYGHPIGDEVLKAVAFTIKAACESKGRCYRYGGEEITVLLPNHDLAEGRALALRILSGLNLLRIENGPPSVTASIGVACYPETTPLAENLIRDADQAMYQAKHAGKNRVEVSRATTQTEPPGESPNQGEL